MFACVVEDVNTLATDAVDSEAVAVRIQFPEHGFLLAEKPHDIPEERRALS